MTLRGWLYAAARFLGDVEAAKKGRLPQRLARRAAYRLTNKWTAKVLRKGGL